MDYFITFSAPMIRAILEGRKTQTRLVAMQQPAGRLQGILTDTNEAMFGESDLIRNCDLAPLKYRAGDRLWVREAHYLTDDGESEYPVFAADQGDVDEHLANMQTTMASWPDIDWSKHLRLRPLDPHAPLGQPPDARGGRCAGSAVAGYQRGGCDCRGLPRICVS